MKKESLEKDDKNFSKNIKLLGSSSLFNDVGSEMITPILPFYVTALGANGLVVGALSGLRDGLASLLKILGGWLSDRTGKRMPFIFLGYIISIISRFLIAAASAWQFIIGFVSFERFGKMRDAPRDAIISDSTKKRGRGFGIHQMMDTVGALIGTILVIFLFWKLQLGYKAIILIAAFISVLSIIPLFFVKEPKIKKQGVGLFKDIKKLDKKLKYFIFVTAVFTLANFGLYMFLLLRAREITGSIVLSLVLYAIFNFVYAIFIIPFGNWSDKIGRKKVLLLGYVLFFIVSLSLIYLNSLVYLVVVFVLFGLVYAITQSNQRAFVSDLSGEMKGTAMGLFYFVVGIVAIPAGIIAGAIWDVSYKYMFAYTSIIAIISIILLLFVREKEGEKKEKHYVYHEND